MVRQRLKVSLISHLPGETENSSKNSIVWYKDEGRKDHGMDLHVTLIDQEGDDDENLKPVKGFDVPFNISVLYSNGDRVSKPNLLTLMPEGPCSINKNSGKFYRRIRINDISKNHQRQLFRIRITPDISQSTGKTKPCVFSRLFFKCLMCVYTLL